MGMTGHFTDSSAQVCCMEYEDYVLCSTYMDKSSFVHRLCVDIRIV